MLNNQRYLNRCYQLQKSKLWKFSNKKQEQPTKQEEPTKIAGLYSSLSKEESSKEVKGQKLSSFWKSYRNNFIQVVKESEAQRPKGSEEYRAAILFEEILRKKKLIDIYDTRGRVFWVNFWFDLVLIGLGLSVAYYYYQRKRWVKRTDDRIKILICLFFVGSRVHMYRRLQSLHVEKIVYNTDSKAFELTMRTLIATKYRHEVIRDKLMFTNDKFLNVKNINYIDIESMKCYQIGYQYAWRNKELFTHLLKQNIQDIRK